MRATEDERLLIANAIKQDATACRQLLEKYSRYAFSIAIKIVKNREDAEEVVQDSFVKAFRALRNFNGEGKFSTWLYKIVFNTALTRIRNKSVVMDTLEVFPDTDKDIGMDNSHTSSFGQLVKADQARLLTQAMTCLSESEGLAITLYYICENTIGEIEEITRWNHSTIKTRLFRAREKLYEELTRLLDNEINELI